MHTHQKIALSNKDLNTDPALSFQLHYEQ